MTIDMATKVSTPGRVHFDRTAVSPAAALQGCPREIASIKRGLVGKLVDVVGSCPLENHRVAFLGHLVLVHTKLPIDSLRRS